jgi:hypothetical protein
LLTRVASKLGRDPWNVATTKWRAEKSNVLWTLSLAQVPAGIAVLIVRWLPVRYT